MKRRALRATKEEIEDHLRQSRSDPQRDELLGECSGVPQVELPAVPLDNKEPTWKELNVMVKKARSRSTPGPSGIPYKVYKKCPKLLRCLWKLLKVIWRKGVITDCWKIAEGVMVPKEIDASKISQFRTISPFSVEEKIFAVLAKRLTVQWIYIDTSVKNGGVPGFPGCLEHNSAKTQLIREVRINHGDLTAVWLDLANASGSVPHALIMKALPLYHVPDKIQDIIRSYFDNYIPEIHCRTHHNSMVEARKGTNNRLYHLSNFVCDGDEI